MLLLGYLYAHGLARFARPRVQFFLHAALLASAAQLLPVLPSASWKPDGTEVPAVLILTIAMVWTAEFLNTALEAVVDLASPQLHPLARVGKDVGAAAVLITAAAAVVVGLLILGPPLWAALF